MALSDDVLRNLDKDFGKISFDRLRTLVVVHRTGSARAAADFLNREQASVQKQLDTLNTHFKALCGQELVQRGRRKGEEAVFTRVGENVVAWAKELLASWASHVDAERARVGGKLRLATTAFTLPILGHLWDTFCQRLPRGVEAEFRQVRTAELDDLLSKGEVDLALAGVPWIDGEARVPDGFTFEPWTHDTLSVLTNLPEQALGSVVRAEALARQTLALPHGGFIKVLADQIAEAERVEFKDVTRISDVYYGVNSLRYGLVKGCMLVAKSIGLWAINTADLAPDEPDHGSLRLLQLELSNTQVALAGGLFGRTDDLDQFGENHPIRIFWALFRERAQQQKYKRDMSA